MLNYARSTSLSEEADLYSYWPKASPGFTKTLIDYLFDFKTVLRLFLERTDGYKLMLETKDAARDAYFLKKIEVLIDTTILTQELFDSVVTILVEDKAPQCYPIETLMKLYTTQPSTVSKKSLMDVFIKIGFDNPGLINFIKEYGVQLSTIEHRKTDIIIEDFLVKNYYLTAGGIDCTALITKLIDSLERTFEKSPNLRIILELATDYPGDFYMIDGQHVIKDTAEGVYINKNISVAIDMTGFNLISIILHESLHKLIDILFDNDGYPSLKGSENTKFTTLLTSTTQKLAKDLAFKDEFFTGKDFTLLKDLTSETRLAQEIFTYFITSYIVELLEDKPLVIKTQLGKEVLDYLQTDLLMPATKLLLKKKVINSTELGLSISTIVIDYLSFDEPEYRLTGITIDEDSILIKEEASEVLGETIFAIVIEYL